MPSKSNLDLTDFLDRMITSAEDVAALDRVRALNCLDSFEYLRFLEQFAPAHPPTRNIPDRHEPFTL